MKATKDAIVPGAIGALVFATLAFAFPKTESLDVQRSFGATRLHDSTPPKMGAWETAVAVCTSAEPAVARAPGSACFAEIVTAGVTCRKSRGCPYDKDPACELPCMELMTALSHHYGIY